MISRREREKDFKKQLIVEAANRLFSKRSFEAVTVEDIARAAEFGKGTLYQYFGSKEEIFSYALETVLNRLCASIEKECPADLTPRAALNNLITLNYRFYKKYGHLFPSLLRMKLDGSLNIGLYTEIETLIKRRTSLTAQVFERGIRDKVFIAADSYKLARLLNKLVIGLIFEGFEMKATDGNVEKDLELIKLIVSNGIILKGETNGRNANS